MPLRTVFALLLLLLVAACQKSVDKAPEAPSDWTEYHIAKGQHYADKNPFTQLTTAEMKFIVKFDNSAIYQAVDTNNQGDINKLYGFSDNNQDHHTNSARIGWRWYNNELQLFAYVYNNTIEVDKMITAIPLNQEISCSIRVQGASYLFTVNGVQATLPRASVTKDAAGYQLYPYFGGDEPAPQDIHIAIKDL